MTDKKSLIFAVKVGLFLVLLALADFVWRPRFWDPDWLPALALTWLIVPVLGIVWLVSRRRSRQ